MSESTLTVETLAACVRELLDAMRRYELDVDEDPPRAHREMIARAETALGIVESPRGCTGVGARRWT